MTRVQTTDQIYPQKWPILTYFPKFCQTTHLKFTFCSQDIGIFISIFVKHPAPVFRNNSGSLMILSIREKGHTKPYVPVRFLQKIDCNKYTFYDTKISLP